MAHELAGALQQASRIRQRCALKESYVYVRREYVDIAKGRISQTCSRTAIMQKLPDFVPAFSHHLKPLLGFASKLGRELYSALRPGLPSGVVRTDEGTGSALFERN